MSFVRFAVILLTRAITRSLTAVTSLARAESIISSIVTTMRVMARITQSLTADTLLARAEITANVNIAANISARVTTPIAESPR